MTTVAVRVRCRTAEAASAAASPAADVSVPAAPGDGPAAVAAAAVRAAGGEAAALAAAPGSRVAAFHRPGAAFPWLPAASGRAAAAVTGGGADVTGAAAAPALIVCVTAAGAVVQSARPAPGKSGADEPTISEKTFVESKNRFFLVDGAWHFEADFVGEPRDMGEVVCVEFPSDSAAPGGFDSVPRVVFGDRAGWLLPASYQEELASFCAATGVSMERRR